MKQKLLLFILPMLLLTVTIQAQTKIWDFGGDPAYTSPEQIAMWPIAAFNAAEATTVEKDKLFLVGDSSGDKFGQIENAGGATWDAGTGDFPVTGAVDVKIWFRSGSSSDTERILYISDGTTLLNSHQVVGTGEPQTITASYTGTGGNIYIYDSNSFNLYKIVVTGAGASDLVLSASDFKSPVSTNIKAIGDRIYVSNVKLNTEVNIYSITGALVKSFKTNADTDFEFKSGLYIATVKTIEGQKAVKLLTH